MNRKATSEVSRRLGMRIRDLRSERGLLQDTLADRIGITRVYLWAIEQGQKSASLETLVATARALDVSLSELFLEVDRETPTQLGRLSAAVAGQPVAIQRRIFRVVEELLGVVRELER